MQRAPMHRCRVVSHNGFFASRQECHLPANLTLTAIYSTVWVYVCLFDTINIVLENRDTLRLVDENFNGFLEVMRVN